MNSIIKMNNIKKEYKSGGGFKALKSVDLSVEKGDFLAITGPSGSGKTTLMNILGFLDSPDGGDYYFEGVHLSKLKEKHISEIRQKKIGYIFQSFNLLPGLTALENTTLPLIYSGISKTKREAIAKVALNSVGILSHQHHRPYELSGGQKQRVAIARAMAINPKVILADEPTGNLDEETGKGIIDNLIALNRKGTTVILITHNKEIAKMAKRKALVTDGVLKFY